MVRTFATIGEYSRMMLKKARRLTRPPTGAPRCAMCSGEGLQIFPTSLSGEQPDCPSLRARRMVWLLPFRPTEPARCASTGDSPGQHIYLLADCFNSLLGRAVDQPSNGSL